jgi:AraC family transcriptional regulator of adaptative response/methylated-DNA-[protein]-cysteine methyltransferase
MIPTALPRSDEARWRAVLDRDAASDGAFVYAVRSTGVFCRPSCPSRRPKRANVAFYDLPEAAAASGFRPCRRCRPETLDSRDPALRAVRKACRLIERQDEGVPTLATLGSAVGLSPWHLQRLFKRHLGISPRDYADARRLGRTRRALKDERNVGHAVYAAGYGSSSRLYERAADQLGMTPATYRKGGAGAEIFFATADSVLGRLLVAATASGVCFVALGDNDRTLVRELEAEFPAAVLAPDRKRLKPWLDATLRHLSGREPSLDLPLDVRATAFQWHVWQALRAIPAGETRTYSAIARALGQPKAARAVGRACATNPVSIAIPCHRAVREDGGLGGYRWGLKRKDALLTRERDRKAT